MKQRTTLKLIRLLLAVLLSAGLANVSMADVPRNEKAHMKPKINTIFHWCNDVKKMREFYSEVLGLNETYFLDDGKHGWLTYDVDGLQLVFMRASKSLSVESSWARQPGWNDGTREVPSMVLQMSLGDFQKAVERAKAKKVKMFESEPRGEQGKFFMHFLMDPMGNTVELYYEAKGS